MLPSSACDADIDADIDDAMLDLLRDTPALELPGRGGRRVVAEGGLAPIFTLGFWN